jgi:hypothetical protein
LEFCCANDLETPKTIKMTINARFM